MDYIYRLFSDPQAAATIIAAFIGAALAGIVALISGMAGYFIQKSTENKKRTTTALENYNNGIAIMEETLIHALVEIIKNKQVMGDFIAATTRKTFSMTMPNRIVFKENLTSSMVNNRIVNKWSTLLVNAKLVNSIIDEFNSYYVDVRSQVHKMYLNNETPDTATLDSDRKLILAYSEDLQKALTSFKELSLSLLCEVMAHAQINNYPQIAFTDLEILRKFTPNDDHLVKIRKEQDKKFDEANLFNSISTFHYS